MQQLETDLNFITSLPDRPAMTTTNLKKEFDKAGNTIKTFINETLEPDITSDIATSLATAKTYTDNSIEALSFAASNISYDGTSSGLEATNVQSATDEVKETLEGEISDLEEAVTTGLAGKAGIGDFTIESFTQDVEPSVGYNYETRNVTKNKSGYKSLGCVGWTIANNVGEVGVCGVRTTAIGDGTVTIQLKTHGNTSGRNNATFTLSVLWVKK